MYLSAVSIIRLLQLLHYCSKIRHHSAASSIKIILKRLWQWTICDYCTDSKKRTYPSYIKGTVNNCFVANGPLFLESYQKYFLL